MLTIQGLSAGYGAIPVLHHVTATIAAGESVGILGHNGMGKTTLLRCLIGALRATAGTVGFEGRDVTRLAPHARARLGMAYVPQGREIFAGLSALDNLRMGLVKTGERPDHAIDALLAHFPRLKPLLERAGGSLSGGEQQLLALARALAGRPKLLLLDEPTEGIQPSIIEEIGRVIRRLATERGLAILLCEQYYDFAKKLADTYAVMSRGEIVASGPAGEMDAKDVRALISV